MKPVFSNVVVVSLASPISDTDISLLLKTGDGAKLTGITPGSTYMTGVLHSPDFSKWEIVRLTDRNGDTVTASRGYDGSTAQNWEEDTPMSVTLIAETINGFVDDIEQLKQDVQNLQNGSGTTPSSGGGKKYATIRLYVANAHTDGSFKFVYRIGQDLLWPYEYYKYDEDKTRIHLPAKAGNYGELEVYVNGERKYPIRVWNDEQLTHSSSDADKVQISSSKSLRFGVDLTTSDVVVIRAPIADWWDKGDSSPYAATGVINSYIVGTPYAGSNYSRRFEWATEVQYELSGGLNKSYGAGGVSNGVDTGYTFGGNNSQDICKVIFDPSFSASILSGRLSVIQGYGTSFTDKSFAWICGAGGTDSKDIYKFDMTTETSTTQVSGAQVTGSTVRYIDSFFWEGLGYIWNHNDDSGTTAKGFLQKLDTATDSLSNTIATNENFTDEVTAIVFRSSNSYLWSGGYLYSFDLTTDALTYLHHGAVGQFIGDSGICGICDGEYHFFLSTRVLFQDSGGVTTLQRRKKQGAGASSLVEEIYHPSGTFTDFYTNC